MGCCPLAPASAFHLCMCLPCCFLRERKMPGFSGLLSLDPHSTIRLAKPIFLLWEQKCRGLGRGITPPPLLEEFVCICHHTAGWLCSFSLLGSLGPVHQRICEKSLQPTAWVARGDTQQNSGDVFEKPYMRDSSSGFLCPPHI